MRSIIVVMLALLCAGGTFQHEKEVRDLIARMGDEEPSARDAAENRIVEIGPAALPLLAEAVKSSDDPEIVSRAKRAIERIGYQEKVKAVCGPVRRVTIDAAKMPLGQVVAEINKQTGETITVDDALKSLPVTLAVKDEPYLKVLHRIAVGTPGVALDLVGGKTSLRSEKFDGRTVACADRTIIKAENIRLTRDLAFGSVSDLIISFSLACPGNVVPAGYEIRLEGFKRCDSDGHPMSYEREISSGPSAQYIKAGTLGVLGDTIEVKGKVALIFVVENEIVEFERPKAGEKSLKAMSDGGSLEIRWEDNYFEVAYTYVVPDRNAIGVIHSLREGVLETSVEALNENGKRCSTKIASTGVSRGATRSTSRGFSCETPDLAKIRVTMPAKIHTEEVPFEITVPLK